MYINEKGQEVFERKPVAQGVRALTRPLSPREEMQRMILEYDASKRREKVRPEEDEDLLVLDDDEAPGELTDAEMDYQLSVAEAEARQRERRAQPPAPAPNPPGGDAADPKDPAANPPPGPPTKAAPAA